MKSRLARRPRVVLYSRVSTTEQSTAQQIERMRAYVGTQMSAGRLPANADTSFVEDVGVSGSVPFSKRPQGKEVLESLKSGDHLVCAKLDRAFRSSSDALLITESLKKRGVKLHILNLQVGDDACINNGMGKVMMTILSAIAELERELIAERTKDQKQLRKKQGLFLGGIVPWYQRLGEGKLIDVPEKQALVERMREWRAKGDVLRDIKKRIVKEGHVISLSTIGRLTADVAPPAALKRGRRAGFKLKRKIEKSS